MPTRCPPAKGKGRAPAKGRGGGWRPGGDERPVHYGSETLPLLDPTRPCPACRTTAHAQRFRDNGLGSEWTCQRGHRFVVGPRRADRAVCPLRDRKAKEPECALSGAGPFLLCRTHDVAIWPLDEDVSSVELCGNGQAIWQRIVQRFSDAPGLREGPRKGEVPFGVTEEVWAAMLAERPELGSSFDPDAEWTPPPEPPPAWEEPVDFAERVPDVAPTAPVEQLVDLGSEGAAASSDPEAVTPPDNDEEVPASSTIAPRPALATALAARSQPADSEERLFPVAEVPVEVKRKRVDALSPSSAKKLKECPRRFEFNKVLGRPEPTGKAAAGGVFGHKILELLTEHPLPARTEDAARALAARLWADISKPPGSPVEFVEADTKEVEELRRDLVQLGTLTDREAVRAFKAGVWAGVKYAVSIEPSYGGEVAYRELWIEGIEVAGVPVRMKVDRIDRHRDHGEEWLTIVDYKFGKYPQARDGSLDAAKLADTGDQLLLYWPAVEMVTGEKVKGALLAYVGEGAQMTLWVDPARLEAAQRMLASLWRDLGRYELAARTSGTPYPAETGYLCGWCPFFEDCQPGSAWLLGEFAAEWMRKREARGELPPPAMVEVQSWTRDRRQAWWQMARSS